MTLFRTPLPETPLDLVQRLEEAGRALLALPQAGPSTRLVQSGLEWVRDAEQLMAPGRTRLRPAVPSAASITRMDEAYGWLGLIPQDKYVLRRIVGARSLVDPMKDRHLFPWRRLATAIGSDHKAVQRWHGQGIALILAALGRADGARPGTRSGAQCQPGFAQPGRHGGGPGA